jgi:hypothetical protein
MRNWFVLLGCAAVVATSTPAIAGAKFAAYEGRDAVQEGRGGTKVTEDGVDFWTTGTPPRKFQVLGVITDKRGTGLMHGKAVGSAKLAAKIIELGGNGAIVLGEDSQVKGAIVSGGTVMVARRDITQLLVVKYLD